MSSTKFTKGMQSWHWKDGQFNSSDTSTVSKYQKN